MMRGFVDGGAPRKAAAHMKEGRALVMREVLRWNPDTGEFKRAVVPTIRRKPMTKAMQRREDVRRQVAVAQYMRQAHGTITRFEAEQMYEEHGLDAPKRSFRK
jgi:hypothetical protein